MRWMVLIASPVWHPLPQMALGCEVYDVLMYLFFMHCATNILDWCWWRILFIIGCHDSSLDVMRNILCDLLPIMTQHVMCWDPLLCGDGILLLSSCMFFIEIPFMPCWQDAHHACFCVILIGVFWLRIRVMKHFLEPLLREDIFLVWSWNHLLCISSLLTKLNVAHYTILTLGLGDVVPPRRTSLLMTYVFMLLMIVLFLFSSTCKCIHWYSFKMEFNTSWNKRALEGSFTTPAPRSFFHHQSKKQGKCFTSQNPFLCSIIKKG